MDEIRAHERGRMYAALVKSYRDGWTPFEAGALFTGYWPDTYFEGEEIDRGLAWFGGQDDCEEIKTAEQWFSENRGWLDEQFLNQESPIVALFDELKSKDELFLLEGLSRKVWTGWDAVSYLSACSSDLYEASFAYGAEFSAEDSEKISDRRDVNEVLGKVMAGGVGNNFFADFYGDQAINKFNRSKDGMDLPHPVGCFRRFSREHLEPQGFKPPIFKIAEEIEAAGYGFMLGSSVALDELRELLRTIPPASVEGLSAPIEADDEYLAGALDSAEVEAVAPSEPKADPDSIEIVAGVTVGDMRALLDERNEGKTFCPVLLAAVRVAKVANVFRVETDEYGFKRKGKRLKNDIETEVRRQLKAMRIYTANAAAKTPQEKTKPSDDDVDAVMRCCRTERIQPRS